SRRAWGAARWRPPVPPAPAPLPRSPGASRAERGADLLVERLARDRPDVVPDDPPSPVDEERLGKAGHAVCAPHLARAVVDERVRQLELLAELARIAVEVLRVDADHDDALRPPVLPCRLEIGRLLLARHAPRRPEVHDDGLAAERRELHVPPAVQARQRETGSRPLRQPVAAVGEPPTQQREQRRDEPERERLRG